MMRWAISRGLIAFDALRRQRHTVGLPGSTRPLPIVERGDLGFEARWPRSFGPPVSHRSLSEHARLALPRGLQPWSQDRPFSPSPADQCRRSSDDKARDACWLFLELCPKVAFPLHKRFCGTSPDIAHPYGAYPL